MLDFRTGQIFGLLMRTLPFLALRVLVYIGITVAYVLAVGIGGGLGYLFGKVGGNSGGGAGIGAMVGFAIVSGLLYWARQYLLYLVRAAHIAVLVQLLDGKPVPGGQGQIAFGRQLVTQHFATSNVLFGLHQLVRGILRVFNRLTVSIASWLPIPGLDVLVKLVDAVIATGLGSLDQVVLAQILRQPTGNPWAVGRDCIVLYAQNYKGVLRNAAFLTLIIWVLTLLILALVAAPIAGVIGLFHVQAGIWTFVLAVIAALSLKAALIDPFATIALIQVYDRLTAGQTPNAEWAGRLETMSGKFRELTQRAAAGPAPAGATPTS
jgi:hypothetical protein